MISYNGVYVAFPFLAGTRPSEQLGLLWDDVDFEANVIRIQRIQLRDGSLLRIHQDRGRRAFDSDVAAATRDAACLVRRLSLHRHVTQSQSAARRDLRGDPSTHA